MKSYQISECFANKHNFKRPKNWKRGNNIKKTHKIPSSTKKQPQMRRWLIRDRYFFKKKRRRKIKTLRTSRFQSIEILWIYLKTNTSKMYDSWSMNLLNYIIIVYVLWGCSTVWLRIMYHTNEHHDDTSNYTRFLRKSCN